MANTRENLILQQISEGATTTRSATMNLGYLARVDRWCRRFVPGYNWLRGKRGGSSRTSLRARGVSSGFIVSAKIRARIPKPNANRPQTTPTTTGVFLETGISKSEFCSKLDYLLRKKLLEQQIDPEGMLLEAIHLVDVEEGDQTEGTQEDEGSDMEIEEMPMENVEMEEAQPGGAQPDGFQTGNDQAGNDQAGNAQTENAQTGNDQAGNNQIGNNQTGNIQTGGTHPEVTQQVNSQLNEDRIPVETETTETELNRNQDRTLEQAETEP